MNLQQHMQANIGASIASPVIDGRWHSGKRSDGAKADKVSYVGHYLPKGVLVRYRDFREPDTFHLFKEWEGEGIRFDAKEYARRKYKAEEAARKAEAEEEAERGRVLAILTTIISESKPSDIYHPYTAGKLIVPIGARQAVKRYQIKPATADTTAQYYPP